MKSSKINRDGVYEKFPKLNEIPDEKFPNHVLIIPDGNGRWAKKLNQIPFFGHRQGFQVLKKVVTGLQDLPINILTIWAFSSDNWKRDSNEVDSLMKLYDTGIKEALPDLLDKKTRFLCIGRRDRIPEFLRKTIEKGERQTKGFESKIFCLAIDYSGQDQEIRMMKKVQQLPKNTKIDLELIKKLRDSEGLITPADLIIRTSGEQRISDLGWLSQNSEFYSIKKFLPEAGISDFVNALIDFSKRERRFGARKS